MILCWIIILLFALYSVLIIYFWRAWLSVPSFVPAVENADLFLSVIIPARNEATNIGTLLTALRQQDYPAHLVEVIVVDDHSDDDTASIVTGFPNVKLVRLGNDITNSYKKKAIEAGIAAASGDLIVCTDADCVPPASWLRTMALFKKEKNSVFIAAPVSIEGKKTLVQVFQAIDFMVLQGITAAGVDRQTLTLCNGANLAYEKKVFHEVNGFSGIDHIASGDDMLLMHKVWLKYPSGVHYLKAKSAIVMTNPVISWRAFFQQRIRWASKARQYDDKRILPVLAIVYLVNLSFLVMAVAGFFDQRYWLMCGLALVFKTVVEWPFFSSLCHYFDKKQVIKWFIFYQPLHIMYTIISGFFGQIGKYEWKGRKVK